MRQNTRDPLFDELIHLSEMLNQGDSLDTVSSRWNDLWQIHCEGEKIYDAPLWLADLLTELGSRIAMDGGDYRTAKDYLVAMLRHPHIDELVVVFRITLYSNLMICQLYLGEEREAIAVGESLLALQRRSELQVAVLTLRPKLYGYLLQQPPDQTTSMEFTDYVCRFCQVITHRKRKPVVGASTFAGLADRLMSTWPANKREDVADWHKASANPFDGPRK